jgi:hypothetical protein
MTKTYLPAIAFLFALPAFSVLGVGCSSSSTASTPIDASACPDTLASATTASCSSSGLACNIGYQCGSLNYTAACTCDGKAFSCVDATGTSIASGGSPTCPDIGGDAGDGCGATLKATTGTTCAVPGIECSFGGVTCSGGDGGQLLDICTCAPSEAGFSFSCVTATCATTTDGG